MVAVADCFLDCCFVGVPARLLISLSLMKDFFFLNFYSLHLKFVAAAVVDCYFFELGLPNLLGRAGYLKRCSAEATLQCHRH